MNDAAGVKLTEGDKVAFMVLIAGEGYSSNSMGIGKVTGFSAKMVRIATDTGFNTVRLPNKIAILKDTQGT